MARIRTNRMHPVDLYLPESELRWSNIMDPFGFSLPCQLPITFRARGKVMEGTAGHGFRIESKTSPIRINEYETFAQTVSRAQAGFYVSVIDAVENKADIAYWESEQSNAWLHERHTWDRRIEGFPPPPFEGNDSGNEE